MTVCTLCIHKALSQYLNTVKWLAHKNKRLSSKRRRGRRGLFGLSRLRSCLCAPVLAVDVEKVSPQVRYPEMLPLGKSLLAESAVHVAVWQVQRPVKMIVGLISPQKRRTNVGRVFEGIKRIAKGEPPKIRIAEAGLARVCGGTRQPGPGLTECVRNTIGAAPASHSSPQPLSPCNVGAGAWEVWRVMYKALLAPVISYIMLCV